MIRKLQLLLLLLATFLCGFAQAQSFEILDGNLRVTSIDGLWHFHTGDNPAWSEPKFDDSQWPLLRSTEGWSTQGYKGYSGMAWYRFQVTVPASLDHVSLYLPRIGTCYEVYADGALVGTFGRMPPNKLPYFGGGSYQFYALPAGKHARRKIEIALRVWHWPHENASFGGGPQYGGGLIGDSNPIVQRSELDRMSQLWNRTSDQTLALLQTLAGLGALTLFLLRRKESEYLFFSLMMLLSATSGWMEVSRSAQVWNTAFYDIVSYADEFGARLALIAFLLALLRPGRTLLLKLAVVLIASVPLVVALAYIPGSVLSVSLAFLLISVFASPFYAWVIISVLVRARQNSLDARLLAAPVILSALAGLFTDATWITYTLGWQHTLYGSATLIQRPCPISLSQVTDVLFLLAVFAILILRFTRTRSEEERFAGEVQAARNAQQFLIPEQMPPTPGLTIESVYRPALEVGGDFFQVIPDASDDSVLMVVGDVAGHGMESGMMATLIVGGIRMASIFTTDPERILALLNKRMRGRGLATCLALRIESDGSATLANAGHLPPYLNGKEVEMEGAMPLGAIPGITFPLLHFKLVGGDTLMLMTDGVAEAQNAAGQLFGFDRIREMLGNGVTASALATAAQEFGQEDDITVLTLSYAGVSAST